MPELRLTRRARRDLEALSALLQGAVLGTLALLQVEPERHGKELEGQLSGLWAARVGSYRVLYTIERGLVIVRTISHRAVVHALPRDLR